MYSVYFERWLNKINPEQIYVTTLEEYKLDKNKVVNEILHFLNVGSFRLTFRYIYVNFAVFSEFLVTFLKVNQEEFN